jgi:dienelactone hydrolase
VNLASFASMRPLEMVFVVASLASLVCVVVPFRGRLAPRIPPLAVLLGMMQGAVEGLRWQLAPFELLAALCFLFWLHTMRAPISRGWRGAFAAGGAFLCAVGAALLVVFPVFRFPAPSGPLAIGTATFEWTDESRADPFLESGAARRELVVQLWYPAEPRPAARRAPYVEDSAVLGPLARLLHLPSFVLGHLRYVTSNAAVQAPPLAGRHPVLIFSHGRGGYRQHDTRLFEELVSRGYVVASISHPHVAAGVVFRDGRVVPFDPRMTDATFVQGKVGALADDVLFVRKRLGSLDRDDARLAGALDLDRMGMFGVSLGGAVTGEVCRREPAFRACLAIDVWMPEAVVNDGLAQPTLFMTRDSDTMRKEGWSEADIAQTLGTLRSTFDRLEVGYFLSIPGMFHPDFSDAPLLSPLARPLGLTGSVPTERAHAIVAGYALAFFDRHVRGEVAPLLDAAPAPDVRFEVRRPPAPRRDGGM